MIESSYLAWELLRRIKLAVFVDDDSNTIDMYTSLENRLQLVNILARMASASQQLLNFRINLDDQNHKEKPVKSDLYSYTKVFAYEHPFSFLKQNL